MASLVDEFAGRAIAFRRRGPEPIEPHIESAAPAVRAGNTTRLCADGDGDLLTIDRDARHQPHQFLHCSSGISRNSQLAGDIANFSVTKVIDKPPQTSFSISSSRYCRVAFGTANFVASLSWLGTEKVWRYLLASCEFPRDADGAVGKN